MASESNSCGVNNSLVFPSDPSATTSITATAGFGSISVQWNYPATNAHALSYVRLYRGVSNTFTQADIHAIVKGNQYQDVMIEAQSGNTYYYWVQLVSINGTIFSVVGPASATARSQSADTLSLLSGQIAASHLAAELRTEIADIPSLRSDLVNEASNRLNALIAIEDVLNGLGLDVTQVFAAIQTEQTTRINGQDVLANQLSAVAVSNGENLSAIVTEQNARVTAISAEASQRETLATQVGEDISSAVDTLNQSISTTNSALASQRQDIVANFIIHTYRQDTAPSMTQGENIGSLWYETANNNKLYRWNGGNWEATNDQVATAAFAAITALNESFADGSHAYAIKTDTLEASVDTLENELPDTIDSRVENKLVAQVGFCLINGTPSTNHNNESDCVAANGSWQPLSSLSQAVLGVQIDDSEGSAKIEQKMTLYRSELGVLNQAYTLKLNTSNNGTPLIGGFGLATEDINGNQAIAAGFDVSRFWIGNPGDTFDSNDLPFIIDNGVTYIAKAKIRNADIDTLKIEGNSISQTSISGTYTFVYVLIYRYTTSTSPVWRNGGYNTLGQYSSVLQPTFTNAYSTDFPGYFFNTNGVDGESYDIVFTVSYTLSIKTRSSIDYPLAINIGIKIQNYTDNTTEYFSGDKYVQGSSQTSVMPEIRRITFTKVRPVFAKKLIRFSLSQEQHDEFYIDTNWGGSTDPDGEHLHWIAIDDIRYEVTVKKR